MAENNNVVAKLCSDGSVHTTATLGELANLVNYKIRTEGDIVNKHKLSTASVPTAVLDLGKQLLLYAKDSDLTGVRTMLARGAPFTSDWLGMSALHFAAMNNQYDLCDVLIKGGMNKDIKTKVDRTPLHFATYYGHERIVEMLLSRHCSVNPKDMLRMTPLHWAIERRHKNIVRMLLKYNADVNVVTKFNKTPIGIAVLTEQPDILAELQVAKAEQTKKKYNEAQEKEISEAVGTILAEVNNQRESKDQISYMEVDESNSNMSIATNPHAPNFERTQETGVLDKNAINLLKSHGISMMQEEDEDASKDLLSTALQNGRQLVLSEGGKMLLNETRQQKLVQNSSNLVNLAAAQQNNTNNNVNNKYHHTTVPKQTQQQQQQQQQQKQQTSLDSLAKNSVRIVSYKEFQHMFYNDADGKPRSEKPTTMSNMRIIRQQGDAAINLSSSTNAKNALFAAGSARNSMANSRQTSQQHRQLKITPMKAALVTTTTTATTTATTTTTTTTATTTTLTPNPAAPMIQTFPNIIKQESNDLSDIIEILPTEIDNDRTSDVNQMNIQARLGMLPTAIANTNAGGNSTKNDAEQTSNPAIPVCFIPGVRSNRNAPSGSGSSSVSALAQSVRQVNVIKRPQRQSFSSQPQQTTQVKSSTTTPTTTTTTPTMTTTMNLKGSNGQTIKPTPNVMPLLSTPEICRQLYETRKQNEELRRRVDLLQKEKEEMSQRLDRLEEMLFVERTDEEAFEIES